MAENDTNELNQLNESNDMYLQGIGTIDIDNDIDIREDKEIKNNIVNDDALVAFQAETKENKNDHFGENLKNQAFIENDIVIQDIVNDIETRKVD